MRLGQSIPGAGYAWMIAGILWLWTFWACAGEWQNTDAYSYGFFVPLLSGYFFWRRWGELRPASLPEGEARWAWTGLAVVVLCVLPVELLRQTPLYWRPILWAMGILAALATLLAGFLSGGSKGFGMILFPACFPLIGIPWPGQVEVGTTVALQGWVAMATGEILNWLGIAAVVHGKTIQVAQCVLGVEEACSGLQSLQSSIMVAMAGGEVFRRGVKTRWLLLVSAVGVALAGNLTRAVILGILGAKRGPAGISMWHDQLGFGIILVVILIVWYVAHGPYPDPGVASKKSPALGFLWEYRVGLVLLSLLVFHALFVFWWYRIPRDSPVEPSLAYSSGVVPQAVSPEVWKQLRPTHGVFLQAGPVLGYHFWWKPGKGKASQFYHRPEVCMPGIGWQLAGPVQEFSLKIGASSGKWSAFPFARGAEGGVLWWATWIDGRPISKQVLDEIRTYYFDRSKSLKLVAERKNTFSYEVAAFFAPQREPDPKEAEKFLAELFVWREKGGAP